MYQHLGLADFTDGHLERAVDAAGSKDLGETDTLAVLGAAHAIREGGLTVVDIVAALDETGYEAEAEAIMEMTRARLSGDYLQTAAIFDEELRVLSLVTDPNDYAGPGTGYVPSAARQHEIDGIRQSSVRSPTSATSRTPPETTGCAGRSALLPSEAPTRARSSSGSRPPGPRAGRALSGLTVRDILGELLAGLEEEGRGRPHQYRINDTVDLGWIGLSAARLSGSGVAIGLQAKGTALVAGRDVSPLQNLELYSVAPTVTRELYRQARCQRRPARQGSDPRAPRATPTPTRPSRPATTRRSSR